jgi:hypothetical protein
MIYNLTYCSFSHPLREAPHTTPWIADEWWTPASIIADFERRFPGSRVVSLEPAEVTA